MSVGASTRRQVVRAAFSGRQVAETIWRTALAWLAAALFGAACPSLSADEPAERIAPTSNARILHDADDPVPENVIPLAVEELPINLPTALLLAEQENPTIALGRQAIQEALALNLQARAMVLPTLNAGTSYYMHDGPALTSFGLVRSNHKQVYYVGGGAKTVAAETMSVPMVRTFAHVGDAIFAPLAARQIVGERSMDSRAITNATLLSVALNYLELVGAESRLQAIRLSRKEAGAVVNSTKAFAQTGQGREGDYQRARGDALLLQLEEQSLQEEAGVASAELSRVLHLDPSVRLTTTAAPLEMIDLVDLNCDVEMLVQLGLMHRPEVSARNAGIATAEARYQQELYRPWFPTISLGYSAGGFGGGSNSVDLGVMAFNQRFGPRTDLDILAFWSVENLGFGNFALQQGRRAERDQSVHLRTLVLNQIRREVKEGHAAARQRRLAASLAERQWLTAENGVAEELRRTRAGEGLPIEALNSVNLLKSARQDLIHAVIGYDLAQFRLFAAIGQTPAGLDVDVAR